MKIENKKYLKNMRRISHIHFVGIGGVGMCGIAEVLFNLGYCISGSDIKDSLILNHLKKLGIVIKKCNLKIAYVTDSVCIMN